MKIVTVKSFDEMTSASVYYSFNNSFWSICGKCGKPVKVDWHRTKSDLERDEDGEEEYFCDANCKKDWIHSVFKNQDDAEAAGYEW